MGTPRLRWALRAAATLAVVGSIVVPGLADSTSWASRSLGANTAAVARCDSDGVGVLQNLSGANVVSVTVSGIASGCAGGTLSVAVDNATTSSSGTATVPGGGGTMTVALSASVPAKDVEEVDVAVSGP
jgi:hypothetical protein